MRRPSNGSTKRSMRVSARRPSTQTIACTGSYLPSCPPPWRSFHCFRSVPTRCAWLPRAMLVHFAVTEALRLPGRQQTPISVRWTMLGACVAALASAVLLLRLYLPADFWSPETFPFAFLRQMVSADVAVYFLIAGLILLALLGALRRCVGPPPGQRRSSALTQLILAVALVAVSLRDQWGSLLVRLGECGVRAGPICGAQRSMR